MKAGAGIVFGFILGMTFMAFIASIHDASLKEKHKKSCFTDVAAHHYYDCLKALQ